MDLQLAEGIFPGRSPAVRFSAPHGTPEPGIRATARRLTRCRDAPIIRPWPAPVAPWRCPGGRVACGPDRDPAATGRRLHHRAASAARVRSPV